MKLYFVKIEDISEEDFKNIMDKINSDKREKIHKFIFIKDKIRALVSEILLRTIFIKDFGLSDKNIEISRNEYGKPYLQEYEEFNFNISHSGDFVVCAIDSNPIGVDIEQITDIDFKSIMKSFFQEDDIEFVLSGDESQQLHRFYDIWTLKESYIKAEGKGLSIPLRSFGFKINDGCIKLVNGAKEYSFKSFDGVKGYKMAVCSINKHITDDIIEVKQDFLINEYYKL